MMKAGEKMTNTGDFRRYSYSSDIAYAIQAFNVGRSSVAPAYNPQPDKELKVRENDKRKSKVRILQEQRTAFSRAVFLFISALLIIAMFCVVLNTYVKKNELTHEISQLQNQLAVAESENTRINSELNSLVSMSMIEQYAVDELGMSKVQSNQIRYIDVAQFKEERGAAALRLLEEEKE